MPDHRPGGPVTVAFERIGDEVALRVKDETHGGGTVLFFDTPLGAHVLLASLTQQLAEMSE
jgi:hypothetical protein